MLSKEQIHTAAEDLYQAEKQRKQIEPLTLTHPDMNMEDAYAVQSAWVNRKIEQDGRKVLGYKIGLTSRAMQRVMKIDTPDYGVLLDDMLFPDKAEIETANFLDPQIEVELAFVLKERLFGEDVTPEQVLSLIHI